MGKVKRSKAAQKALESRVLLFLSDKRLADNSFEILSGIQTYYKDVYFCLATSDCTEARLAIDSQDSSKRTDLFEQFEQKLIELCYLLGSLRDWKQTLDLVGNGYGSSRIVTEFIRMFKMYSSFLKCEKETCKIVLDIWRLIQVLDASSLVDPYNYFTYMSNLYEKIKEDINLQTDFSENDLYVELKSLAENGSDEADYLCEGLRIAFSKPVTPRELIERVDYALKNA